MSYLLTGAINGVTVRKRAPAVVPLVGQPDPYLTTDDGFGPSSFSMVANLQLGWRTQGPGGGDWLDANGVYRGSAAYAAHRYTLHDSTALDITALVRKQVVGPNRGLFLRRAQNEDSGCNLGGRLAVDPATRPLLTVATDAGTFTPPCQYFARWYLDGSNNPSQPQDTRTGVGISTATGVIMRFDLSAVTGAVQSATLRLTCIALSFGSGATVQVFEADPPRIYEGNGGETPQQGIAAAYPFDEGLAQHPAALFVGDFGRPAMWHYGVAGGNVVRDDALHSNVLRGRVKIGGQGSADVQQWLTGVEIDGAAGGRPARPAWEEMYLRYYALFEDTFYLSHETGWKMPGLGMWHGTWEPYQDARFPLGGYYTSSASSGRGPITATYGGIVKTGAGKWLYDEGALRGHVGAPLDDEAPTHPYRQYMPLGSAPYHKDMTAYDGGNFIWPNVVVKRGQWYCIEVYAKMNSIDLAQPADEFGNRDWAAARRDGVMRAWVDGKLVADSGPRFAFRRNPRLGLRGMDGNWFYGGRATSSTEQWYRWRDVVLATQYIGQRNEGNAKN